ncbi:MAG TPA: ComE operon protein 2 [Bacillota bacterium]|nr:ComE operon protein 2 [Bacillota bacterium]
MDRISWDQYFMAQCYLLAQRSTCTRLMVGATIVRDNRIIASGYNGSVSGSKHCIEHGCYIIDNHCVRTIHAEANALLQCAKFGVPTEGASMYVTHFPCLQCCKQIIQSGIRHIFYASDYRNSEYALELFQESQTTVKKIELKDIFIETNNEAKEDFVDELMGIIEADASQTVNIEQLKSKKNELYR